MFDLSHKPEIGVAQPLAEGVRVVTAPNASPMTFTGTNTYILGEGNVAVIDPGPDDPAHFEALKHALRGQKLSHIIITHSHIDHSPLARRLAKAFDAPILGFGPSHAGRSPLMEKLAAQGDLAGGEGIDSGFLPDTYLNDGDKIIGEGWQLEAVHTPGHLSNHLCFAWEDMLFSGDHVMGWSSTLVSPPDGDLTQFMASMHRLTKRAENTYFPGHGAQIENAHTMVDYQITHRLKRESQILQGLADGLSDISALTRHIYIEIDQRLWPLASRNVLAHLIDLLARGKVSSIGALSVTGQFQLV